MKLSEWRTRFKQWLDRNVVVDSYSLDRPQDFDHVQGFIPPLRDVDYTETDTPGEYNLLATQDFFILKRIPGNLSYASLPLNILEGMYATLAMRFISHCEDIHPDIMWVHFDKLRQPLKVTEITEDDGDWLIEMMWSLTMRIRVEPEVPLRVPYVIDQLTVNVWESQLKQKLFAGSPPETRVLDFTFTTPVESQFPPGYLPPPVN